MDRLTFPLEVEELDAGTGYWTKGLRDRDVRRRSPRARAPSATRSSRRNGRADSIPSWRDRWGFPEGPLWGEIHRGRTVTLDDGRVIEPSVLVGAKRPGRRIIVTGDTRPCAGTIEAARGADLLVHEATFGDEERERAVETGHSTAREAACVARDAGVRALLLTHFSARYSRDASDLGREARGVLREHDGGEGRARGGSGVPGVNCH